MIELLGIVFGGVSRLAQHWLDLKDKQKEREHEANMFDKQSELAIKRMDQQQAMAQMSAEAASEAGEWAAIRAGVLAQAEEAKSAGGFVLKLSASVRPVLAYWIVGIYSAAKGCTLYLAMQSNAGLAAAVAANYTEFDGAILGAILGFYYQDRSLRKGK